MILGHLNSVKMPGATTDSSVNFCALELVQNKLHKVMIFNNERNASPALQKINALIFINNNLYDNINKVRVFKRYI